MNAVIHDAGVYTGAHVMPVIIVAPYLLTALIDRPQRLVYLSSSEHRTGRASLTGIDWSGSTTGAYPDSKLFVTTLAAAVARKWPEVFSTAVDSGWEPTRMGGPGAPDDLRLGHLTQKRVACHQRGSRRAHVRRLLGIISAASSRIPPSLGTPGSRRHRFCFRASRAGSRPAAAPLPCAQRGSRLGQPKRPLGVCGVQ
jgi:hypothetical protein